MTKVLLVIETALQILNLRTTKARFYGHRYSGKAHYIGQLCYDGKLSKCAIMMATKCAISLSFGPRFTGKNRSLGKRCYHRFAKPSYECKYQPIQRLLSATCTHSISA